MYPGPRSVRIMGHAGEFSGLSNLIEVSSSSKLFHPDPGKLNFQIIGCG